MKEFHVIVHGAFRVTGTYIAESGEQAKELALKELQETEFNQLMTDFKWDYVFIGE